MPNVVLYHTEGCHLCEQAHDLLQQVLSAEKVELIDILDTPALMTQYQTSIPVLVNQQTNASLEAKQRDERIFDALDYITSSLIRLEEKLDDLEQRLPESESTNPQDNKDSWQEDDLLLEEELTEPVKKRSNTLLYSLIAMVILLLAILGVVELFPEFFSFLES